jgi:hypothetical protein
VAISPKADRPAITAAFCAGLALCLGAPAQRYGQDQPRREQADHQAARVSGQHPQLVAHLGREHGDHDVLLVSAR